MRVPGRVFTLATLFYALLAGAGAQLLVRRSARWGERLRLRACPRSLGAVLADG